jgi:hypothetical protein
MVLINVKEVRFLLFASLTKDVDRDASFCQREEGEASPEGQIHFENVFERG